MQVFQSANCRDSFPRRSLDTSWNVWRLLTCIAQRKVLAIFLMGLLAASVDAGLTAVRTPVPKVHDEFSYLLAADTFSSGRWTNPTHPHWQHFESFHIIHQPSYASKYQPGPGALLALGTIIGGHPIVGAWLATALAAMAVCWMLQGWVPNRWALVGGLLVALHAAIHAHWSLSYWGGSLPLAGGALMFGALPRIVRTARVSDSLLLATGALILASTRPFEGFVIGICVSAALIYWLFGRDRPTLPAALCRVIVPAMALLFAGLALLAYYNIQVTGDPLHMPYSVHEESYGYSPLFLWQDPPPIPEYRHRELRQLHTGWAMEDYQKQQTFLGWLAAQGRGLVRVGEFFFGVALCIPMLMLPQLLQSRRLRFAWITLGLFLIAQMMVPWTYAHYFAPAAPLLFLLAVQGLRYLRTLPKAGHDWGRLVVPAVIVLHVFALTLIFVKYVNWQPEGWQWNRARILTQLEQTPGTHLVFVHYDPDHVSHAEWVYNRADIDGAKVVWAREMSLEDNQRLIDYFEDRSVWRINADETSPELIAIERQPTELVAAGKQRDER